MAIRGATITRGGREWQVVSTVRTAAGLRVTLRAAEDPECRILAHLPSGAMPERASDLSDALSASEARWFRDQAGDMWKVTFKPESGVGIAPSGWLVFNATVGQARARTRHEQVEGISALTDDQLVRLLYRARTNPE